MSFLRSFHRDCEIVKREEPSRSILFNLIGQKIVQITQGESNNEWYGRFENGYGFYLLDPTHYLDQYYDFQITFLCPEDYNQIIFDLYEAGGPLWKRLKKEEKEKEKLGDEIIERKGKEWKKRSKN